MATIPKPPTTPTTISIADEIFNNVFSPTPTPTTVVVQPKSTGSTPIIKTKTQGSDIPLSDKLNEQILYKQSQLYGTKYTPKQIETASVDLPWYKDVALAGLKAVAGPLALLDTPHRIIVSSVKEGLDLAMKIGTGGKRGFAGEGGFSLKDYYKQIKDPNTTFRNTVFAGVQPTGNKYVDGTIFFALDVLGDPLTYASLGTGTAAEVAVGQLSKKLVAAGVKEGAEVLVKDAAEAIVKQGVKGATKQAAEQLVVQLGESAAKKEIRQGAAAIVAKAAQVADEAAKAEGRVLARGTVAKAARQWGAAGPRRTLGGGTKRALADALDGAVQVAKEDAIRYAGTAQGRVAENFVRVVTPEIMDDVATRGYAALRKIGPELGLPGGLRWGLPYAPKVTIPGTSKLTGAIGQATSRARLGLWNWEPLGYKPGEAVGRFLTGAEGGGPEVINIKVGLNSGALRDKAPGLALENVKRLAENDIYKGINGANNQVLNSSARAILSKPEYKPYLDTVHTLVQGTPIEEIRVSTIGLEKEALAAAEETNARLAQALATKTGRSLDEVKLAQEMLGYAQQLGATIDSHTGKAAGTGFSAITNADRWWPQVGTNKSSAWLAGKNNGAEEILKALELDAPPLPGRNFGNALKKDKVWFGHPLLETDLNIARLNELANKPTADFIARGGKAFKGNFFETNAAASLQKFNKKFAGDWAFLKMIEHYSGMERPSFISGTAADEFKSGIISGKLPIKTQETVLKEMIARGFTGNVTDFLKTYIPNWSPEDIALARAQIVTLGRENAKSSASAAGREITDKALVELDTILELIAKNAGNKDEIVKAWASLGTDLSNNYINLFSRPSSEVVDYLAKIKPDRLKTFVNLIEDAYVSLDNMVTPDGLARADIAQVWKNIRTLKDPVQAGQFARLLQDYNQFVKTWLITTPGFHNRNIISGTMQMLGGGAKIEYALKEGLPLSRQWNEFLEKNAKASEAFIGPPEKFINKFFTDYNVPKNQRYAFKEALLKQGAAGGGQTSEVLGSVAAGKLGFFGNEATNKPIVGTVSRGLGKVAEGSRNVGGKIENHMRFMFTYDGIRQGLTPAESVARTSKFLIDYSNLSAADAVLKQVVPFWMFMSRNLPAQIENMFYNPQLYQLYNQARKAYTDKDGNNILVPDYISRSGAFPIAGRLFAKPDLGFPGAGSPSPLETGLTDPRSITGSIAPQYLTPLEILFGEKAATGEKIQGVGDIASYVGQRYGGPVGLASRYLNPLIAGTDIPGLKQIPGIKKAKEPGTGNYEKLNSLLSLLGIPLTVVTPNQENSARYEIINRLNELLKNQ